MRRLSFRLTLLIGFLLVSLLLGVAAWRTLLVLERFADQSRAGSVQAMQMTTETHLLAERSIDLERSARQYLVLQEPELKTRFIVTLDQARQHLGRLKSAGGKALDTLASHWEASTDDALAALQRGDSEAMLAALNRVDGYNAQLADAGRQWIDRRNAALVEELERNRRALTYQVVGAVVATLLIALTIGWWLARPVSALEGAIERLGAGQFEAPVDIRGPDDLRRLGQRLDWLRQRLAQLEADRVRVLRHVSHELKTPLAAMREGVALLQEQVIGPLTEEQQEVAHILEHNSRSLQRQIEDLLHYHATVFDAGHLRRSRVALRDLLETVADDQKLQWQARALQVQVDAERHHALLDADKLRVALGNLLSNAIGFSPDGAEIRLVAAVRNERLQIDCIDAGPGVSRNDIERIFEPFVQGRRRPESGDAGSGVGLSIVRELIAAHGGQVQLLPSARGAHFRIEMPYEP